MTRLLFSGAVVLMLVACSFDVNVKGIPKTIAVDVPQLRQPTIPPQRPADAGADSGRLVYEEDDEAFSDLVDAGDGDQ